MQLRLDAIGSGPGATEGRTFATCTVTAVAIASQQPQPERGRSRSQSRRFQSEHRQRNRLVTAPHAAAFATVPMCSQKAVVDQLL